MIIGVLENIVKELEEHNRIQSNILEELMRSNKLKEQQLIQDYFFIELIEEVLPIDRGLKKHIHERSIRFMESLYRK